MMLEKLLDLHLVDRNYSGKPLSRPVLMIFFERTASGS